MKVSFLCVAMAISFWCAFISSHVQITLYREYSKTLYYVKFLLDFLSYPAVFLSIALLNYASISDPFAVKLTIVYSIISSLLSLFVLTYHFIHWGRTFLTIQLNSRVFPLILTVFLYGLLMALSSINYAIYYTCPSLYVIPSGLSTGETAFEFIYYTFTLAVTYGSNSIIAAHVVTKVVQILEICYFYLIIGNVVVKIINSQKPNQPSK